MGGDSGDRITRGQETDRPRRSSLFLSPDRLSPIQLHSDRYFASAYRTHAAAVRGLPVAFSISSGVLRRAPC